MAAEQPFLQNESSGLPPACKPKLQQAGVYYLVSFKFQQIQQGHNKGKVHAKSIEYNHYSHINRERCERDFILTVGVCSQLVKSVSLEFGVCFSHCELRVCEAAKDV